MKQNNQRVICCMCQKPIKDFSKADQNPFFHNWWHDKCKKLDDLKVSQLTPRREC